MTEIQIEKLNGIETYKYLIGKFAFFRDSSTFDHKALFIGSWPVDV